MSGQMALRILRGEKAPDIPLEASPSRCMFDYRQLKRFHVQRSALPDGSLMINEPESVYHNYRNLIWGVILAFGLMLGIVVFLVGNIACLRQAETALRESEAKFFKLFDSSPIWIVLATLTEGRHIEANRTFYLMTGYSREEVLGRRSVDFGLRVVRGDYPFNSIFCCSFRNQ